jgi:hypothetical protein
MLTDDKGKTSGNIPVNSPIAAGPVDVSKSYLIYGMSSSINNVRLYLIPPSAGESSAATQDGNSDSKKVIKEEASKMSVEGQTSRILPKTPPAADGNMNPGNYIPKAVIVSFCFS